MDDHGKIMKFIGGLQWGEEPGVHPGVPLLGKNCFHCFRSPGADPGFPVGGSADPSGGGDADMRFCQIFLKTA